MPYIKSNAHAFSGFLAILNYTLKAAKMNVTCNISTDILLYSRII